MSSRSGRSPWATARRCWHERGPDPGRRRLPHSQARPRPQVPHGGGDAATAPRLFRRASRRPSRPAHAGAARRLRRVQTEDHATQLQHALCYGLGLRAGEACGLRLGDVDGERQLLVVRGGKFGKSRLVPHGPRIGDLVARQVERCGGGSDDDPLFSFDGHRCVNPQTASQTFHRLIVDLGFPVPEGVSPPVLHSLRHSFAVGCLLRWYGEGLDPSARLYQLSTFMGHVDPTSTAIYLTITPALLAEANRRFEAFAAPAWSEVTR
ncbi:MAG: tyrosine-type recombinase/integrase [Actinobacteria bacterium]|nr:tyrosine-type recombinase/integrase [Actinomycetota bacterium]